MTDYTREASDGYRLLCTASPGDCNNPVRWKLTRVGRSWSGHAACDEHTDPHLHEGL